MDEIENIDAMVDEILGDAGAEKKSYKLACIMCGDVFEARTPNARYCPACRAKAKSAAGRKGAEKAHGLKTASAGERIAAAPAEPRNDEPADASPRRHSEEAVRPTWESASPKVTREALLEMARTIVSGGRDRQYGSPEDSFWAIAHYWTVYLQQVGHLPEHRELTAEDTAIMMILLKIARQAGRGKLDNWVDIAGYAACGAEITAEGGHESIH